MYKHESCEIYLYYLDAQQYWAFSSEPYSTKGEIYANEAVPAPYNVSSAWRVFDVNQTDWVDDDELSISCSCSRE